MLFKSNLLVVTYLLLFVPFIINCGDDDNPVASVDELVGTWDLTKITMTAGSGTLIIDKPPNEDLMIVTFNNDKTYQTIDNLEDEDTPVTETGTWSVSGNEITLVEPDESVTMDYSISGNKLTITFTDTDEEFPDEEVSFTMEFTKR